MDAVLPLISNDADHFAPRPLQFFANPLADGRCSIVPQLAREVLRNHGYGPALIDIGPCEIPPREQPVSHGSEQAGRNKFVAAQCRDRTGVSFVLRENRIAPTGAKAYSR